ncbi:MAG: hypothetical protein WBW84_16740 [Acidobacteriaceae bacterium]
MLVGKMLTGLKIANDRQALLFQTTDGEIVVDVDADCCSYTWVEHIELPALGFPAIVTAVEELDMPEGKESKFHTDPEFLAYYGCKIVTDKGEIVIDYRNDSNGYYGGSLSWPGEDFYGDVYGQNRSKHEWVNVE